MSDDYVLATIIEDVIGAPEPELEPVFSTESQSQLYRDLVLRMEADVSILPGMGTVVGMMIRKLARDYVMGLASDMGDRDAPYRERDTRMMQTFKAILDQAGKADIEHALRTEFVIGLVTETMRVIDAEVEDQILRIRLKELLQGAFVTYTDGVKGRIV